MIVQEPDDLTIFRGSAEWSALYVGGKLDQVGDHYLVHERVYSLLGIDVTDSDDFMQGGDSYEDVADNLEQIEEYTEKRLARAHQARVLRDQAAVFLAQADEIERRSGA